MGATNDIKGTNITLKLAGKNCSRCSLPFTQLDIQDRNFEVWFDTSNDVNFHPARKGYYFSIWIRSIEHKYCPEIEFCERCEQRLLLDQFKEHQGNYYCLPCYQRITNHYDQ